MESERQNLSPQELEKARSANRRVVLRIDALPGELLKRVQAQGGWREQVQESPTVNPRSTDSEPTLNIELPMEKEVDHDQAQ